MSTQPATPNKSAADPAVFNNRRDLYVALRSVQNEIQRCILDMETGVEVEKYGILGILAQSVPFHIYTNPALVDFCDTAFTDGSVVFFYAGFVEKLIELQQAGGNDFEFVCVHELGHILRRHSQRLMFADRDVANIAMDIRINQDNATAFPKIYEKCAYFQEHFSWGLKPEHEKFREMSEENIYAAIMGDPQSIGMPKPCSGSLGELLESIRQDCDQMAQSGGPNSAEAASVRDLIDEILNKSGKRPGRSVANDLANEAGNLSDKITNPQPQGNAQPGQSGANSAQGQQPGQSGATSAQGQQPGQGGATSAQGQQPGQGGATSAQGQQPGQGGGNGSQGQQPGQGGGNGSQGQQPGQGGGNGSQGQQPGQGGGNGTQGQQPGQGGGSGTQGQQPGQSGANGAQGQQPGQGAGSGTQGQQPGQGGGSGTQGQQPGQGGGSGTQGQQPGQGGGSGAANGPNPFDSLPLKQRLDVLQQTLQGLLAGQSMSGGVPSGTQVSVSVGSGDIHVISPEEFNDLLQKAGLGAAASDLRIDTPEGIAKNAEKTLSEIVNAAREASKKEHESGGRYPGAHINDYARKMIADLAKPKLSFRFGLRDLIYGDGMKFAYTPEEAGDLFYCDPADMSMEHEVWVGSQVPSKSENIVVVIGDSSGSVSDRMYATFMSEALGIASEDTENKPDVLIMSADTVARGEPEVVTAENVHEFFERGVERRGYGGTDFNEPITRAVEFAKNYYMERHQRPPRSVSVLYFTDFGAAAPNPDRFPEGLGALAFFGPEDELSDHFRKSVEDFAAVFPIKESEVIDLETIEDELRARYPTSRPRIAA